MIILLFVSILLGMPVAYAIGIASVAAIAYGNMELIIVPQKMLAGIDSFPLLAVPFFVLAGNLMTAGGINKKIMDFAGAVAGWISGSKAIITVVASAIFAAISGSGTATVSAIGGVTIPTMKEEGYAPEFAAAVSASSSILGPLIPPSVIMIVYGNATQSSVADLFKAAVVPGILLAFLFVFYSVYYAKKHKLPTTGHLSLWEVGHETKKSIWALLMPVLIIGGIFGGVFTPTEAAAVIVVYAFLVGVFVYRELTWKALPWIVLESGITTASIMILVSASKISSWVLAAGRVPEAIAKAILGISDSPVVLLLLINVLLLIVGMLMEANVAVLIFTPILLPLAAAAGVGTVQLGVIMCVNLCLGLITPPVGLCLLLGNHLAGARFSATFRQTLPFIGIALLVLLLTTYIPQVSLWLPGL
ncbi:MAG: TRAP transporter large permease subunit [Lachnospiraceae bacterium]|nr:TRAP transporter large permease subunit [Lachnospiraceae bacterium]